MRAADGTITYEMSDEDYLQDFDLFQQVFDSTIGVNGRHGGGKVGYSELAAGLPINKTKVPRAFDSAGVPAPINNSGLSSTQTSDAFLNASKMEENNTIAVRDRLSLGSGRTNKPARDSRSWEQRRSTGGSGVINAVAVPNPGDLSSGSVDASGPPEELGQASQEVRSLGGDEREPGSFIGDDPDVALAQVNENDDSMPALEPYDGRAALAKEVAEKEERRRVEREAAEARVAKAAARGRPSKSEDSKVLEVAKEIAANPVAAKSLTKKEAEKTVNAVERKADRLSNEGKHEEAWEARIVAKDIKDSQRAKQLEESAKALDAVNPGAAAALRKMAQELIE